MADYSALDATLSALSKYGPELANGFTNHAPMAIEALAAMGRADATAKWFEDYRPHLLPRPRVRMPVVAGGWRDALGNYDRFADWAALFEEELAARPWRDVVALWAPRFMPGISAAAFHGVIRVGHAVRAMENSDTPQRRRELADALGYWASTFGTLPEARGSEAPMHVEDAIARVPIVPVGDRRPRGAITAAIKVLDAFPAFASVIDLLDVSGDPARCLSDLTEAFARIFLANAHDGLTTIVFIHAVTGPVALRSLLPLLSADEGRRGLRYAWQGSAALYSAYASAPPTAGAIEIPPDSREKMIDLAVSNGDDHAIKFTEACLREHAREPRPAYLAAVRHAIAML